MASVSIAKAGGASTGALIVACVAEYGSLSHPYFSSPDLVGGPESARNLADAVHFLCALHGRHPGIIDHAAIRAVEPVARAWLLTPSRHRGPSAPFWTRLGCPLPGPRHAGEPPAKPTLSSNAMPSSLGPSARAAALWFGPRLVVDWAQCSGANMFGSVLGVTSLPGDFGNRAELRGSPKPAD